MISTAIHITTRTGLMNCEACAVFVDAVDPTDWAHAGIPPPSGRHRRVVTCRTSSQCSPLTSLLFFPTTCMAIPQPATGVALNERQRLSAYIACTMCQMSCSRKSHLLQLGVRTISYSVGRAWKMMSSYLSSVTICPICSRRPRHSSGTKNEIVRILAGLHLHVDDLLVPCPSGFLSVAAVLLSQSLLRYLFIPRSMFWPLSFEGVNCVVGGDRYG